MSKKLLQACVALHKFVMPIKAIGLMAILLLSVSLAKATSYTWTGATSTAWATTTNWSPNGNPGSATGDIVSIGVIPFTSGNQPVLSVTPTNALASITLGSATTSTLTISANYLVGSLNIGSGSTVSESTGVTVTFTGDIVNNGTYTASNGAHTFATNAISLYGTWSIPNMTANIAVMNNGSLTVGSALAGTGTLNNASIGTLSLGGTCAITTLNNGGTTTFTGTTITSTTFTNNGTLNLMGSGTITAITNSNGGIVNLSSSGTITTFTNGNAGILNISALIVPAFTTLTATAAGNIVNYNGAGAQTVKVQAYLNLTLSGSGAKAIATGTSVTNKMSIAPDLGGATANIATGANIAVRALFLGGTNSAIGTWGYSGRANNSTIYFANTTGYLTVAVLSPFIASTAGAWATGTTWTGGVIPGAGDDVIINVAVTMAGITQTGSVTINSGGTLSNSGTSANIIGSLTINTGGTLTSSRVLTVNGATNISGAINLSGGRANIFNGDFTLNSGSSYSDLLNTPTFTGSFTNFANSFTSTSTTNTFTGAGMAFSGPTITSFVNATITGGSYINSGTLTLTTSLSGTGTLINNGTLNLSGAGAGSCAITSLDNNGIINRTGAGTTTTAIANFSNWGTINLNGSGAITGITNNAAGIVNLASSGTITAFTNNASSTLNISASSVPITTLTATAGGNTVVYNGSTQTVKGTTYSNLTINAGISATLGAPTTVSNNLSVTSGIFADGHLQITGNGIGTLNVDNGATLQIGDGTGTTETFPTLFTTANISLGATSTVIYNSTSAMTVAGSSSSLGPSTYGNLTLSGASTKTVSAAITIAGNLVVNAGTFADGGNTITVKGNVTNNATYSGTGEILLSGGSALHVITGTADTYGTLELNDAIGATIANISGTTNIGTLTVTAGTLNLNSFSTSLAVTNTNVTGTLTFNNNTGARSMGAVTVNSGGIVNITVAQSTPLITITSLNINGGTWDNTAVNEPVTITGAAFTNTGTFNSGTGTYTFSAATSSISGNATIFSNLTINSTTGTTNNITASGGLTVSSNLTGTGNLIQASNALLNIGGTSGITNLTVTNSGNTVNFTGVSQTVNSLNYYNLILSGSGTDILQTATTTIGGNLTVSGTVSTTQVSNLAITGNLTVSSGATFATAAGLTLSAGTIQVDGTFNQASTGALTISTLIVNGTWNFSNTSSTLPLGSSSTTWAAASNLNITGSYTTATVFTNFIGQTFGNFTYNCPGQTNTVAFVSAAGTTNIQGNFNVASTGTSTMYMRIGNQPYPGTINIYGNFILSGGNFDMHDGGTYPTSEIINLDGNFTMSGGTLSQTTTQSGSTALLNISGSGIQTVNITGGIITSQAITPTCAIQFIVANGATIDMGTSVLTGTNNTSFTLSDGAGIISANTGGLSSSGATGSIQVSGPRTYSPIAEYTFNSLIAGQVTGNGVTAADDITFSNTTSSGVTFSNSIAVSGTMTITHGADVNLGTYFSSTNILVLDGIAQTAGTSYGGNTSSAANILPTYFNAATGILNVSLAAPSNLSYNSPFSFPVGVTITEQDPTVTGIVTAFSVSPSLPTGLIFNTSTGAITGTPTLSTGSATYTVTASNSAGNTSFGVVISVGRYRYAVNTSSAAWNLNSTWAATSGGASGASYPVSGDQVFIGEASTSRTVTIPSGISAACGSLTMGNSSNATTAMVTISGTGSLSVDNNLVMNRPFTTATTSISVGSSNLTVGGTLQLANSPGSYVDNTLINSVTISTGTLTVGNLYFGGQAAAQSQIVFTGAGTLNISGSATTQALLGTLTPSTGTVNFNGSGAQTIPFLSAITYNNLTLSGGNTKTLSANTTVPGILTVNAGVTLANGGFTLSTPSAVGLYCGAPAGSSIIGSGLLTLGGNVTVSNAGTGNSGATISCPVALGAARTFTVANDGTSATDLTVSGIISGSYGTVKTGPGTMVLSGANSFSGGTTVSGGTLKLGASSTVSTAGPLGTTAGTTTVSSGAVLDLNGFSLTSGATNAITLNGSGLTGAAAGALTNTGATPSTILGAITLGSASTITASGSTGTLTCSGPVGTGAYALTLDGDAGSTGTMSGILSTPTSITKTGQGFWTLSGANSYTGATNINAGTLMLGNTSALGTAAGTTIVTSGASLDLNGITLTAADPLTLNGTGLSSIGALLNSSGTAASYNGAITLGSASSINTIGDITLLGAGITGGQNLTKSGNGMLSLGTSTASLGGLTISAGVLTSTSGALNLSGDFSNNGTFTHNSGTVNLNGSLLQNLWGSNSATFNNLTLNNSSGAFLGIAETVGGTLTLTSGILTSTATNLLAVTNTASGAVTGYSATSYVNGPLQWSLANANSYLFPVGDASNYRPFELNNITCASPVVRVTMSGTGASTVDGTLSSVAARNWYAQLISGTFTSATVRITEGGLGSTNVVASSAAQSGTYTSQGGNSIGSTITSNAAIPYTASTYFAIGTKAPAVALSDNGTQVTAASVAGGTSNVVLHQSALAVTLVNATLTGMTCTTAGSYISSDITNLKVWYQTTSTFNAGTATLLSTLTTPGTAGAKTFPSFTSQTINSGTTGYIFITADVAPGATVGNTININALVTSDFTFNSATKSGSTTAGGVQTFTVANFYNKSSGAAALQTLANWGTNTDGTGTAPLSFTTNNQIFNIYNGASTSIGTAWTVSGTGSKVILGNAAVASTTFTVPSGFAFTGPIDIAAALSGSNTLTLQNATVPTLGTLNAASTVVYGYQGASQTVTAATYGNLTLSGLSGTTTFTLGGTATIAGNLSLTSGTFDLGTNTANRSAAGGTLTVSGTLLLGGTSGGQTGSNFPTNFSTVTLTGSTVSYYSATGGQTIYSTPVYATLTLGNTSGSQTAGGNLTATTLNNNANAADILNMGSYTLTVTTPNNTGTIRTQNTSATPVSSGKTWGGTVTLDGSSAQTIPASTFNNLTLNNAAGATLSAAVNVGGTLTLTSGILTSTATNLLAVTNTASGAVTGYSATSYVNGPLQWSLANANSYLFPVGTNSTYYPFALNNVSGTAPVLSVQAFATSTGGTAGTGLCTISSTEYWQLTYNSGTFTNGNISLTRTTALSGLDAIGKSTILSGAYINLNGTPGSPSIASSDNIGSLAGGSDFFVMASKVPTITLTSAINTDAQTVCINTSISNITYNIAGSGTGASVSGLPTGVSGLFSGGTFIISGSPGISSGSPYSYTVTSSGGSCSAATITGTITVNAPPAISIEPVSPAAVCTGTNSSTITVTATGTGLTYQWQRGVSGIYTSITGSSSPNDGCTYSGFTSATLTVSNAPVSMNGYTYRCVVSGTCTPIATSDGMATLTVNPATAITSQSTSAQSTCLNVAFSQISVTASGTGTLTYQWYSNTTANNSGGTSLGSGNGANTNSYTPQATTAGTLYYYCIVHGDCGADVTSAISGTFTVIADLTWTGATSTDWNTISNWSCPFLPGITTNILIPNVTNKPILSSGVNGMANNIVISSGSSLTVTSNIMQIAGTITNSGTFDSSAGTIQMEGSSSQTIGAATFAGNTVMNLTVSNSSGVTLAGPLNVTGVVKAATGDLTSGGNLVLISAASQTALVDGSGSGNVVGNVTMQRYLPSAFGYKYISSPFQSATVSGFSSFVDLGATFPNFYKYDENNHHDSTTVSGTVPAYQSGWVTYTTGTNPLVPMYGYAANFGTSGTPKTFNLSGVVNNGPLSVTLYNNNRKYTQGFNLVGNPYPSPINWNATGWTKTNIDNAIYFFNTDGSDQYSGEYTSYVNGTGTGNGNNMIASMQGFFIHVSDGAYPITGTLGMTNSVRTNDLAPTYRDAILDNRTILRFTANLESSNPFEDVALIYFDNLASRSFNKELDALKLINTAVLVPNLYTISTDPKQLSIYAIPQPGDSTTKIPVGITTLSDGWVTFKAKDISSLPASLYIYLVDNQQGITQDLKRNPDYRFNLKAGTYNQRFTLVFSLTELNPVIPVAEKMFILKRSASQYTATINLPGTSGGSLFVTNMLGQIIMLREVFDQQTVEINPGSSSGLYIVTVISGNRKQSEKILIQ